MIDALIKRVSVTYKCYEMYAHRGEKVQTDNAPLKTTCSLYYLLSFNTITKKKKKRR
jgi:hypothetical protein